MWVKNAGELFGLPVPGEVKITKRDPNVKKVMDLFEKLPMDEVKASLHAWAAVVSMLGEMIEHYLTLSGKIEDAKKNYKGMDRDALRKVFERIVKGQKLHNDHHDFLLKLENLQPTHVPEMFADCVEQFKNIASILLWFQEELHKPEFFTPRRNSLNEAISSLKEADKNLAEHTRLTLEFAREEEAAGVIEVSDGVVVPPPPPADAVEPGAKPPQPAPLPNVPVNEIDAAKKLAEGAVAIEDPMRRAAFFKKQEGKLFQKWVIGATPNFTSSKSYHVGVYEKNGKTFGIVLPINQTVEGSPQFYDVPEGGGSGKFVPASFPIIMLQVLDPGIPSYRVLGVVRKGSLKPAGTKSE